VLIHAFLIGRYFKSSRVFAGHAEFSHTRCFNKFLARE